LRRQIKRIKTIEKGNCGSPEHAKWKRDTSITIEKIFGEESKNVKDFEKITYCVLFENSQTKKTAYKIFYEAGLNKADAILKSFIDEINDYWEQ